MTRCEYWTKEGKFEKSDSTFLPFVTFHRDEDAAIIQYDDAGIILSKTWYQNGLKHRENKPAHILYYQNGNISLAEFYNFAIFSHIIQYTYKGLVHSWYYKKQNILHWSIKNNLDPNYISEKDMMLIKLRFG